MMAMETPFLKGLVFEEGTMRMTWEGELKEGKNCTQLLVRCMLGLKLLPFSTVSSPHVRNVENTVEVDASKLSLPAMDRWDAASRILQGPHW